MIKLFGNISFVKAVILNVCLLPLSSMAHFATSAFFPPPNIFIAPYIPTPQQLNTKMTICSS